MSFTIRRAAEQDAGDIHRLVVELAIYEKEPDQVRATPADFARHGFGERPIFEALIAEVDERASDPRGRVAVGLALYFYTFSTWTGQPTLYLEDLFVLPQHRGAGIGHALFAELARIAVERGCARYEWQVLDWNQPAIDFYERSGARRKAEWLPFRLEGEALARLAASAEES